MSVSVGSQFSRHHQLARKIQDSKSIYVACATNGALQWIVGAIANRPKVDRGGESSYERRPFIYCHPKEEP